MACILLGTAAHLTDTDAAVGCLKGAAAALSPGGIVVLELEHPFDLFEGTLMNAEGDAWDREVDGVKVGSGTSGGEGRGKAWGGEGVEGYVCMCMDVCVTLVHFHV